MKTLRLRVLTPRSTVYDGDVDEVVVPLADGWLGVMPGHSSFAARLIAGEVVVRAEGRKRLLATLGGTVAAGSRDALILTGVALLDSRLEELEREISDEVKRLAALEQEAEKHFDRVYRQMARAFNRGSRHP